MSRFARIADGDVEVVVVSDGVTAFPSEFLMIGVDESERLDACERWGFQPEAVASNMNCVYINTGDRRLLFDTGAGNSMPGCGQLFHSLSAAGIHSDSIDQVIHTHAHLDHLGSNVTESGRPAFQNATYCVGETEWRFWSDQNTQAALERSELWKLPAFEPAMAAVARSNLLELDGRVRTFADDGEPAPGVRALPAYGHTPGHLAFEIELGHEKLVVAGDLALNPAHIERSDWYSGVDLDPDRARKSRREIFDYCADTDALVIGYHLPFPGLGRLRKSTTGWDWIPVEPF